jgi:16S rRNA processing protein RimM
LNEVDAENLLLIGRVIRPHGLKGLLRIISYAESGESFLRAGRVLLKPGSSEMSEFKVASITASGKAILLSLEGISSMDAAERYRGAEILIPKSALRKEADDEFFWFELIGLDVYLKSGRFIGILKEIINTGSNDIYVVKDGEKEHLIPALHGVVLRIDPAEKRMLVADNIDGLLDLNEV